MKNEERAYVFFDIDGTLLPSGELVIPRENIEAIEKLKENGHIPFICTGRSLGQARNYIEQIGAESYVTSNGQHANFRGDIVYDYNMSIEDKQDLSNILANTSEISWGYENGERIYIVDGHLAGEVKKRIEGNGIQDIRIVEGDISQEIKQMWGFGRRKSLNDVEDQIAGRFHSFRWADGSLEIIPLGESKGKAVEKIKELNPGVKTYAFGDGYNDMELLRTVDVGVAMGNAYDAVKECADHVTADCRDNGIEKGLRELGLI